MHGKTQTDRQARTVNPTHFCRDACRIPACTQALTNINRLLVYRSPKSLGFALRPPDQLAVSQSGPSQTGGGDKLIKIDSKERVGGPPDGKTANQRRPRGSLFFIWKSLYQFLYKVCHFVHSLVPLHVLSSRPFSSRCGGNQAEKKRNPTADFKISMDVNL